MSITSIIIGYDITDSDKEVNKAQAMPVYYDKDDNSIYCIGYDYNYSIGKDSDFNSLQDFITWASSEGWFTPLTINQ